MIAAEVKPAQVVAPAPVHQPVALFDDADEDEYIPQNDQIVEEQPAEVLYQEPIQQYQAVEPYQAPDNTAHLWGDG